MASTGLGRIVETTRIEKVLTNSCPSEDEGDYILQRMGNDGRMRKKRRLKEANRSRKKRRACRGLKRREEE